MFIDKNTLNFLQFRDEILNIEVLEAENHITLPPIYRAFITTFKAHFPNFQFGIGKEEEKVNLIFPKYFYGTSKQEFSIDDNSICPMNFKEPEELLSFDRDDMWAGWEGDIIFIADHSYWGGLMLGISKHNADKIYHQDGGPTKLIANNIFEFLKDIYYVADRDDFPNLQLSNLYRNWGEKFWRLRKE